MSATPESSERDPVEVLAEEYFARQRRGERPTVDEYADRHPALAERIRRLFPTLALLEEFVPPAPPPPRRAAPATPPTPPPRPARRRRPASPASAPPTRRATTGQSPASAPRRPTPWPTPTPRGCCTAT